MMNYTAMDAAIIIVVLVLAGVLMYRLIAHISQRRLMRCPKTGAITFVDAAQTSPGDVNGPGLVVRNCDLWADQKNCDRGCLVRYGETTRGFRVDLHALRDFGGK